eukprot:Gb_19812 [translate_table: standard]
MMNDEEVPFVQIPREKDDCMLPAAKSHVIRYFCCCFGSAEKGMENGQSKSTCFQGMNRRSISMENSTSHEEDEDQIWWQKGWSKNVNKAREWSVTIIDETANCCGGKAKWKHIVRRTKNNGKTSIYNINSKPARFQYDPHSYALNFDQGSPAKAEYSYLSARSASRLPSKGIN